MPRWEEVRDFRLYFRNGGEFAVDSIELVPGKAEEAAYLSLDALRRDAFGEEPGLRTVRDGPFVLMTDSKLPTAKLWPSLRWLRRRLHKDLPGLAKPTRKVPLLVFAEAGEYRRFWPAFGERLGSRMDSPTTDGLVCMGIASAAAKGKTIRPVYLQEACHAYLALALEIPNHGEWLHEGLANHYQDLRFPQGTLPGVIARGVSAEGRRRPLVSLTDGRTIGLRSYWQAVSFTRWLLADAERREGLMRACVAFRKQRSTRLEPVAEAAFGLSVEELEKRWLAWARSQ